MVRLSKTKIEQIAYELAEEQFPMQPFIEERGKIQQELIEAGIEQARIEAKAQSKDFYQVKDVEPKFWDYLSRVSILQVTSLPTSKVGQEVRYAFGMITLPPDKRILSKSAFSRNITLKFPKGCKLETAEAIEKWISYFKSKSDLISQVRKELSQFTTVKKLTDAYPVFKRFFQDSSDKKKRDLKLPMALLSSNILQAAKKGPRKNIEEKVNKAKLN